MANKTISDLPSASEITGEELIPIVQDSQTVQTAASNILAKAPFPVTKVNGYTGVVNISASDVGALSNTTGGSVGGNVTISSGGITVTGASSITGQTTITGSTTVSGNISGSATPAAGMTTGFVCIPKLSTAPTGGPIVPAGYAPMVFDSVTFRLYIHTGTAWKSVLLS